MKFLVRACDAQSWAFAGSKELGAIRNGMRESTLIPWRPGVRIGVNLLAAVLLAV